MKRLLFSLLVILSYCSVIAQPMARIHVTFTLRSPDLPGDTAVYITGSIDELGNWDPGNVKMAYKGDHSWSKEIDIDTSTSIEYKYTLGSWEREGAQANGLPLSNLVALVTRDTVIEDEINFWTKGARKNAIQGHVTGTVRYHRAMRGSGIADRDLIVWLPPGYETDAAARYPVVYMHDGQNIFDPATSSFGVDWQIDETCDSLIRNNSIPPVIVVGIYNTSDRMKEYVPGVKGTAYMNFVVNTVKPFIDSVYRTKPGRENTIVGGSSAGGTISFMLAWEHPDVFSKAICMSPAFKIGEIDYVKDVGASLGKTKDVFFYIDNGGVGLETRLQPGVNEMLAALKTKGYQECGDFVYISEPTAQHNEAAWAKRFAHALVLCLLKK